MLDVDLPDHPTLEAGLLACEFAAPLDASPAPGWMTDLLRADADAPFSSDDDVRAAVRDLLRHGGYKPTGRGKPSAEYLVRAVTEGRLPSINLAVDACNVVSLHSGLPISVVDCDLVRPPLAIAHGSPGSTYVFNASGQEISVAGLLCLCDADGPCANAVKDSQRTKTHAGTRATLSVVWGTRALPGRTAAALAFYAELLERAGARVETALRA